jgi:hypothetical protein
MTEKSIKKKKVAPPRILYENPYDLEVFFESLSIASRNEKELIYMDRLITSIRLEPFGDLTTINYRILQDLGLIKLPNN